MRVRAAARLPLSLGLLAVILLVLGTPLAAVTVSDVGTLAVSASFASVGALVAHRRPENPIGWLFCAFGVCIALDFFATRYATRALVSHPGSLPAGQWLVWASDVAVALSFPPLIFLFLLFPSGRLLSRRWRPLALLATVTCIVGLLISMLWSARAARTFPFVQPPFRLPGLAAASDAYDVFTSVVVSLILVSAVCVFVRQRRVSGTARQQLKWFTFAVALVIASVFVSSGITGTADSALFVTPVIPVAAGIAILKHRLYDIDVIINRSLVYGSLTAMLGLAYVLCVFVFGLLLSPVTEDSGIAVAASTLAVAAFFRPGRARIQRLIDRRFFRRKYDAERILEAFSISVRNDVDLEAITGELLVVVEEAMTPAHATLWLRNPDVLVGQTWGANLSERPAAKRG